MNVEIGTEVFSGNRDWGLFLEYIKVIFVAVYYPPAWNAIAVLWGVTRRGGKSVTKINISSTFQNLLGTELFYFFRPYH